MFGTPLFHPPNQNHVPKTCSMTMGTGLGAHTPLYHIREGVGKCGQNSSRKKTLCLLWKIHFFLRFFFSLFLVRHIMAPLSLSLSLSLSIVHAWFDPQQTEGEGGGRDHRLRRRIADFPSLLTTTPLSLLPAKKRKPHALPVCLPFPTTTTTYPSPSSSSSPSSSYASCKVVPFFLLFPPPICKVRRREENPEGEGMAFTNGFLFFLHKK